MHQLNLGARDILMQIFFDKILTAQYRFNMQTNTLVHAGNLCIFCVQQRQVRIFLPQQRQSAPRLIFEII